MCFTYSLPIPCFMVEADGDELCEKLVDNVITAKGHIV